MLRTTTTISPVNSHLPSPVQDTDKTRKYKHCINRKRLSTKLHTGVLCMQKRINNVKFYVTSTLLQQTYISVDTKNEK